MSNNKALFYPQLTYKHDKHKTQFETSFCLCQPQTIGEDTMMF